MSPPTLILNPWMQPHRVASWQEVITLLVKGAINVIEEYDETVSSPSTTFNIPAVVRLVKPISGFKKGVKFSRVNVFTRDGFSCCYCGVKNLPMKDLNYDHVVPRIQGGKTVWENIVTSCYPCNDKKAGRTPEQAKMKLLKPPHRPKTLPMTQPMLGVRTIPDLWKPYIDIGGGNFLHG
jgi:5-methylcytosine-specific restriction endonuclease McrA